MRVKLYGTRGSTPVADADKIRYGGNTTCIRIFSDLIPAGQALGVDAGSGFRNLCRDLLSEGTLTLNLAFSHWHHDHTQGLPMGFIYRDDVRLRVWGPKENERGPEQVFATIMHSPVFPVSWGCVRHRFKCETLDDIGTQVLVIHPTAGFHLVAIHLLERAERDGKQLSLGSVRAFPNECLIVKMYRSSHPQQTISYRFEERTTGKVFVFLTDHENTDGIALGLHKHIRDADLLIMDTQYTREFYDKVATGWGHATPDYAARLMKHGRVKRLGTTHHDPNSSDADVDAIVEQVRTAAGADLADKVFGCCDYMEIAV